MLTDSEPVADHQRKHRDRRTRTREDREKRDAAFTQKRRGRPKGSRLSFGDDPDRFAIAMIYCGKCFLGLTRYEAAYLTLALTSDKPIEAGSIDKAARLSGGPLYATLKGASYSLIAKCDRPMTDAEAYWVVSSAELLGSLIELHAGPSRAADPTSLRMIFDWLAVRGWAPTLLKLAEKLSAISASNLPPIDEPVSARVQAYLQGLSSKPKS